ncbi:MAG: electron transfer flavoprotein subunit beta/FixA family protein, partial [Chitinophagales bacterium]|nr:electron transfer flavoprotein subunit beta/FixA family protein [Chitinophagales bacterium]
MKILVCVCQTPDTAAKIDFVDNNTQFNANGVTFIMNPTDEWYALVRAIELKKQHGGTVTTITVGGAENEQTIRKGLAIGADDAVRIDTNAADSYGVAAQIAEYARSQNYDLILTGKETIDYNGSSVGGMIAELLDLPYLSGTSHLDMPDANTAIAKCEIEGGIETLSAATPLVISSQKGMAEQVIPNMQGIMLSRRKPLTVVAPAAINDLA